MQYSEKRIRKVMRRHADPITKHQLKNVDKKIDVVDASPKPLNKEDNNDNDDNTDEDDNADDDNKHDNYDDNTRTLANVVKGKKKKRLMARG